MTRNGLWYLPVLDQINDAVIVILKYFLLFKFQLHIMSPIYNTAAGCGKWTPVWTTTIMVLFEVYPRSSLCSTSMESTVHTNGLRSHWRAYVETQNFHETFRVVFRVILNIMTGSLLSLNQYYGKIIELSKPVSSKQKLC